MLNYAIIFQFLADRNIQGKVIADWLDLDESRISNIKNNNRKMQKTISHQDFYDRVFKKESSLTDEQGIEKLYDFLESKDCLTDIISSQYENYKNNCATAENFILSVLRECSYDKQPEPPENTTNIASNNRILSSAPCFPKFKNPISGSAFFGRKDMMISARTMLENEGICIIYGIGGLGKSYCSLRYALQYESNYVQIQQVIFSVDIKNTILKINFDNIDESHLSEDERLENRLSIMSSFDSDTLLIIDNMDSELSETDRECYERLKRMPLHILFTTRETQIDSNKYLLPISPLSKEEQLELFVYYGQFNIDDSELEEYYEIFDMVEGHTLLLELIAKTMAAETLTPAEMKEILYSPEDDISKISIEKDNTYQQERMNKFVSKLFDTSKLSNPAKDILMHLSLTSISGIRQRIMKQLLNCDNTDINALISKSWIIQNRPGGADSARIHLHPVIRAAVINNTHPDLPSCISFIEKVGTFLEDKNDSSNEDCGDLCEILANSTEMFSFENNISLLDRLAQILWNNLYFTNSYNGYCKILDIISHKEIPEYSYQVQICERAGEAAVRLALYIEAINHYKAAVSLIEENQLADRIKQAVLYDKLGVVMRKASRYPEALDYFTRAQNIIDIYHLNDDSLTATIYNDMGVIYINLDVLDKALENYQKARQLRESLPSPNKKEIAYTYHNIGTVYQRQKEYKAAIEWHKKALEIRKEVYKENDPIIAASLTMIGNDYTQAAHNDSSYAFDDAFEYFQKGLEIRESTLGETHPDTAWSHQSIGDWYLFQHKLDLALDHYCKCYEIRKTILQPGHAYIGEILGRIGETYLKKDNKNDAKCYLSQALEILDKLNKVRAKEHIMKMLGECL